MPRTRDSSAAMKMTQSVDRALSILNLLAEHPRGLGVSSIAEALALHVSTAYRLLSTLMAHGLVRQQPETNKYRLGLRLVDLGTTVLGGLDIREEAAPFLHELQRKSGEVVHLGVLDGGRVVYIDKVEPLHDKSRIYSRIGRQSPAHCTGLGKVLLAFAPEEVVERTIAKWGLQRFTPATICEPAELKRHLREVRAAGYAVDNEEHEKGVCCVAAPVMDHAGEAVAAVSVTGFAAWIGPERMRQLAPLVVETAGAISDRLHYQGEKSRQ